jgi:hypothetical protein
MKKTHLIFYLFLLFQSIGIAQTYFQQEVHYTINVTLDDVKNEITADESIEYINNSPNELSFIYMHLWANAYKNNTTSLAKEFLNAIGKNIKKMETIIKEYNKKIEKCPKTATGDIARLQKEKSDTLKGLIGISDKKIKSLIGNSFNPP